MSIYNQHPLELPDILSYLSNFLHDEDTYIVRFVNKKWNRYLPLRKLNRQEHFATYTASKGYLDLLIWARSQGCPWNMWTCANAARNNHLEILKWARSKGCSWNKETCAEAAMNGHLEVLKWAHENGCRWDERTCSLAAKFGYLDILKWARENDCPWAPF